MFFFCLWSALFGGPRAPVDCLYGNCYAHFSSPIYTYIAQLNVCITNNARISRFIIIFLSSTPDAAIAIAKFET